MKKIQLFVLAGMMLPGVVLAQSPPQLSETDMGGMMQQMQAMQQCMGELDQDKLEALSAQADKEMDAVRELCNAGKRDEAQKKAIRIGRKFMQEPEMVKMRKCTELMQGALPEQTFEFDEEELEKKHICD